MIRNEPMLHAPTSTPPTDLRPTFRWKHLIVAALIAVVVTVLATPVCAQTVGGGDSHALIVDAAGIAWTVGLNSQGRLGDVTTTQGRERVSLTDLGAVVEVAAGTPHTVALKADGTVDAWGANSVGQVGDGTTSTRTAPVSVTGLTNVSEVAVGPADFTLALTSGGTVHAWGRNTYGQLGDGTTTDRQPAGVVAGPSNVVAIAAGAEHAHSLTGARPVATWPVYTDPLVVATTATLYTRAVRPDYTTGVLLAVPYILDLQDTTPPIITAAATPAPNADGWHRTPVTVSFHCVDDGIGVASCPAPVTIDTAGANQTITVVASDHAQNTASLDVVVHIDLTPPTLTWTALPPALTSSASIQISATVSDVLSGLSAVVCDAGASAW